MKCIPLRTAPVRKQACAVAATFGAAGFLLITGVAGCTSESTRVAIESQRRADAVETAVFDRQHEALRILLYRDVVARMNAADAALTDSQREVLVNVWNDRDLIEWWRVQHERSVALRRAGVDAKLYGDQSTIDLLVKSAEAKFDRANSAAASSIAAALAPDAPPDDQKPKTDNQ